MKKYDIIIIGAGVVGAFVARELSKYELDVLVLEKENDVGNVTSMANSAIVHSGYDPVPNTNKQKFNVLGNKMFDDISKELDVSFVRIGSLTVAVNDGQIKTLKELQKRAVLNGVEVDLLTAEEVKKIEPNITQNIKGALFAKTAGIVNPFTLVAHAFENAVDNGIELKLNQEVVDIQYKNSTYFVKTKNDNLYESSIIINAAGLGSADIARMVGEIDWDITPRKGEYYVLDHYGEQLVKHVIFPLPSEKGKGILVAPTTSGNFIVGPSSELVDEFDDFSTDALTLKNVKSQAVEMIPEIPFNETIRVFAGLRATCTRHDFVIEPDSKLKTFINLGGIESPGLVSSPAIGKYVVEEMVSKLITLNKKDTFNPYVKKYIKMKSLPLEERNKIIETNPDYGEIVCFCEQISLGELKDAFSRSVPPRTVKAVKKRLRSGFGKCQGGFCQPRIVSEISKYFKIPLTEVLFDKNGSEILKENAKEAK